MVADKWQRLHRESGDKMAKGQRPGQAYVNTLFDVDPLIADKLCFDATGPMCPFYEDAKLPAMFAELAKEWQ